MPDRRWEVVNQARVHFWRPGVPPFRSLDEALAAWPETATCVGVWLDTHDTVHVIAPLGLEDLWAGVLRRNPRCGDEAAFATRLRTHGFGLRWPGVRVVGRGRAHDDATQAADGDDAVPRG